MGMQMKETARRPDTDAREALRLSRRMTRTWISHTGPGSIRWHYEHGFTLFAVHRVGEDAGDASTLAYVSECVDHLLGADGEIKGYRIDDFNLDMINPGRILLTVYKSRKEERLRKALALLRTQLRQQPRTRSGGFWHKKIYPDQMWLDGLYMASPFYARYALEFGEPEAFDDIAHQFLLIVEHAREPKSGLFSHGWDESGRQLWANPENGRSPCFWSRAMGWFAMALVDVLEVMPRTLADRQAIVSVLQELLEAVIRFQDEASGVWYQVMDQGAKGGNYLETSASCMFVYSILKALRLGFASDNGLAAAARKAYRGITERFVKEEPDGTLRLEGTCGVSGLGGKPYRDGSFAYYVGEKTVDDDPKGVAAFILASLEVERS
jgi:unsaturated rhamnogalacturonyl hydrolase